MRFCGGQNFLGRAEGMERFQYIPAGGVVYTCDQLAVGEGPRASRAELNVRFGVENTGFDKPLDSGSARFHVAPALEHERAIAASGKRQRAEHTARTETHHHRTRGQRLDPGLGRCVIFVDERLITGAFKRFKLRGGEIGVN